MRIYDAVFLSTSGTLNITFPDIPPKRENRVPYIWDSNPICS